MLVSSLVGLAALGPPYGMEVARQGLKMGCRGRLWCGHLFHMRLAGMLSAMARFQEEDIAQQLILRVTDLEMLFTHLQRTLQELDQVVVGQQRQLDTLEQAIQRLARDTEELAEAPVEPLDLEDERPPHY